MTRKTIDFKVKKPKDIDTWVANNSKDTIAAPIEKMKRFTIDVPESLHKRIKITCAANGTKMANVIREILEKEFPE